MISIATWEYQPHRTETNTINHLGRLAMKATALCRLNGNRFNLSFAIISGARLFYHGEKDHVGRGSDNSTMYRRVRQKSPFRACRTHSARHRSGPRLSRQRPIRFSCVARTTPQPECHTMGKTLTTRSAKIIKPEGFEPHRQPAA